VVEVSRVARDGDAGPRTRAVESVADSGADDAGDEESQLELMK
jgi:hypothetical protein